MGKETNCERRLAKDVAAGAPDHASTKNRGENDVISMVEKELNQLTVNSCGYTDWIRAALLSVFHQLSRMQFWIQLFIAACIVSMVNSIPTLASKEMRPCKYKTQLFDCGVPGKIKYSRYQRNAMKNQASEGGRNCLEHTF